RIEREREIEEKRKQDEERARQHEVIKAKATLTGPKTVGTIDLDKKKPVEKIEEAPAAPAPVAEIPTPAAETKAVPEAKPKAVEQTKIQETPADQPMTTQYTKLTGATLTGQTIDLSQFEKPKKKKEEPKITPNKPGAAGAAGAGANKNKRKRIAPKPGTVRPGGTANPNKITPNAGGARGARPGFVKG